MSRRIPAHRDRRPAAWQTSEVPLALPEAIAQSRAGHLLLIDCLTLWLSNLLLEDPTTIEARQQALCRAISACQGAIILIANEVGCGIVPEHPLARSFRDAQGSLNQEVAAVCDRVELVVAGLPLRLK